MLVTPHTSEKAWTFLTAIQLSMYNAVSTSANWISLERIVLQSAAAVIWTYLSTNHKLLVCPKEKNIVQKWGYRISTLFVLWFSIRGTHLWTPGIPTLIFHTLSPLHLSCLPLLPEDPVTIQKASPVAGCIPQVWLMPRGQSLKLRTTQITAEQLLLHSVVGIPLITNVSHNLLWCFKVAFPVHSSLRKKKLQHSSEGAKKRGIHSGKWNSLEPVKVPQHHSSGVRAFPPALASLPCAATTHKHTLQAKAFASFCFYYVFFL